MPNLSFVVSVTKGELHDSAHFLYNIKHVILGDIYQLLVNPII